jgi:hypothetical protein
VDDSVAFGGWAGSACSIIKPSASTVVEESGTASESVTVQNSQPQPQPRLRPLPGHGGTARSGSSWSYPFSLFRPRDSLAVTPEFECHDDSGITRAEERLVALKNDAPTLDAIQDEVEDATNQGGTGPLSPYSSQPFTTGQSRVLASLYSRTAGKDAKTEENIKEKPWEEPSRLVRTSSNSSALDAMVDCQSAALWVLPSILGHKTDERSLALSERNESKTSDVLNSPSGPALSAEHTAGGAGPTGLFRMPRRSARENRFTKKEDENAN